VYLLLDQHPYWRVLGVSCLSLWYLCHSPIDKHGQQGPENGMSIKSEAIPVKGRGGIQGFEM
jgi:hypothetical protein